MTSRRLSSTLLTAILATMGFLFLLPGPTMAQEEERVDMERAAKGRVSYRLWCTTCHGENAEGDGPIAEHLRPSPANLTLLSQRNRGEFPAERVRRILEGREPVEGHGSSDMPTWGDAFKVVHEEGGEEAVRIKINALAHYLRSIQAGEG
ncbi:c-type cytochrome [Gemmatimonadota bacterium]